MEENNAMNATTQSHPSGRPGPASGAGKAPREITLGIERRAAQQGTWGEHCAALHADTALPETMHTLLRDKWTNRGEPNVVLHGDLSVETDSLLDSGA